MWVYLLLVPGDKQPSIQLGNLSLPGKGAVIACKCSANAELCEAAR